MFFDPLEIPDALLEAQELGKLVIFAGAGVSMGSPSDLPSFKGLVKKIAATHPLAATIDNPQTRLDRFLSDLSLAGVEVERLCRTHINIPSSRPTELHRSLLGLFLRPEHVRIVTTNFDNHFKSAAEAHDLKLDHYYAPALPLGDAFCGVVHLHGSISRPEPLVLSAEDFGRAYLTQGWAREFLERLFEEFTTLFVGYSHDDLPVEYLARGMAGRSRASRFALAATGVNEQWASQGISEIGFQKLDQGDPFQNLNDGVRRWAEFSEKQPTEIAERVKNIVCASENLAPDRSETSLLLRCLMREDSCHFFTNAAKGWRWVSWLQEQGVLAPLFHATPRQESGPQSRLAGWLADQLLDEETDRGLLLLLTHGGTFGSQLRRDLCRRLSLAPMATWQRPLIQKWALLLATTCPLGEESSLWQWLSKGSAVAPRTLGVVLLQRLTALRLTMTSEPDLKRLMESEGDSVPPDTAAVEISMAVDEHELRSAWVSGFKPLIAELREPLMVLMENRLREAYSLNGASIVGSCSSDPFCYRGRIYAREAHRIGPSINPILDFFLDLIDAKECAAMHIPEPRIVAWLVSGVPVLVRTGLYALHLSTEIQESRKVDLLRETHLIYPAVFGATHEAWLVISGAYGGLDEGTRKTLWDSVDEGPVGQCPAQVDVASWAKFCENRVRSLTWILGTKHQNCPEAARALAALKRRYPEFIGTEGMDQAFSTGGEIQEGSRSPKTVVDLLSTAPSDLLGYLLEYVGGIPPFEPSREGLLHTVGTACVQNAMWAIDLLQCMADSQKWGSDLWTEIFWRIGVSQVPPDKLSWLLDLFEGELAESAELDALTHFLFQGLDMSAENRPAPEALDRLIAVSLKAWRRAVVESQEAVGPFKDRKWGHESINSAAGRIVEFWLIVHAIDRGRPGRVVTGFANWILEPLAEIISGSSMAARLGRAALGLHLRATYEIDPAWASTTLFQKLSFVSVGEEAFLLWEPHVRHGKLSRDLILRMPVLYQEAFAHFVGVELTLETRFFGQVAAIVCSGLIDVQGGGWLTDFLTALTDAQRARWTNEVRRLLATAADGQKERVWTTWMKSYWDGRTTGVPCPIESLESAEILMWVFMAGGSFAEAVELAIQGPPMMNVLGRVLHALETDSLPETQPAAVLKLLNWILNNCDERRGSMELLAPIILRLRGRGLLTTKLEQLRQTLTRLNFSGVGELWEKLSMPEAGVPIIQGPDVNNSTARQ